MISADLYFPLGVVGALVTVVPFLPAIFAFRFDTCADIDAFRGADLPPLVCRGSGDITSLDFTFFALGVLSVSPIVLDDTSRRCSPLEWLSIPSGSACFRLERGTGEEEDDETGDNGLDGVTVVIRREEVEAERFRVRFSVVERGYSLNI